MKKKPWGEGRPVDRVQPGVLDIPLPKKNNRHLGIGLAVYIQQLITSGKIKYRPIRKTTVLEDENVL